ncbi:unnamed protein product [Ceratitis capitata]|uniref:(Mediterranean fruit fly) hypothetical protein n=1 Tax=Ceratitis capitata TaxID=7213 RepID=A0A811V4F4_CERCA|nr:unnamed protein product [Ceratitis capitata]
MHTKVLLSAAINTTRTKHCNALKTKPQPTSLPVSERLRFFNNLTEAANRSASSSYTRSPSQRILAASDRCGSANSYNHNNSFTFTPRSSYNGGSTSTSSASVTPTPMECCSPPLIEQQHQLISINEIDSSSQFDMHHEPNASPPAETQESSAFIQLTKSSSQTLLPSVLAQRLAMSAPAAATTAPTITTSPSTLTPVARRIKMKTIGKLLLPQTFLNNERNSQQNISANASNNFSGITHNDTCESESGSCNETDSKSTAAPLKKIGKIKSPFIENCLQMQQKHHQLNSKCMKLDHKSTPHNALSALENNGPSGGVSAGSGGGGERDVNSLPPRKPLQNGNAGLPPPTRVESNEEQNTVSGKENNYCVTSSTPHIMLSPTASTNAVSEQQTHSPVVEMRKKFTRIMNNSTLSTLSQRHAVHSLTNGIGSAYSNAQVHGSSASSAPPTPRNSIIDDKFAKYFGLTPSCSQNAQTDATITTAPNHKIFNTNDHSARTSQLENASSSSESNRVKRSATNYPPLPPPDFCHTPLNTSTASDSTDDLAAMGTLLQQEVHALPFEAINYNVCSNSNTPYYTPPSTCPYDITTPTTATAVCSALPTLTNATTHASSSSAANALQRRRDMAKRQRANTTNVTFTPTSSNTNIAGAQSSGMLVTPGTGRARALRSRAFTLTHGMPMPEVKRFEEIVVTKEEFQLASKEFERIFLGVI